MSNACTALTKAALAEKLLSSFLLMILPIEILPNHARRFHTPLVYGRSHEGLQLELLLRFTVSIFPKLLPRYSSDGLPLPQYLGNLFFITLNEKQKQFVTSLVRETRKQKRTHSKNARFSFKQCVTRQNWTKNADFIDHFQSLSSEIHRHFGDFQSRKFLINQDRRDGLYWKSVVRYKQLLCNSPYYLRLF